MKMKKMMNKFSILTIALIFSGLTMSACASAAEKSRANDKATGGTEQGKSAANDKKTDNKADENKAFVENEKKDSTVENQQTGTKEFEEAKGAGTGEISNFAKWNIIYGADQIEINADGRGKRITSTNVTSETDFSLPLQGLDAIDNKIYFAKYKTYKDDWIFLYDLTDGESGGGSIVRLDGKTLKSKWNASVSGFNVGKGLIENQFAYFGANGFAAKIDLESGKYVWKHDNFYRKYKESGAFNSFDIPKFDGETVVFTELENNAPTNSIIFDKASGKVVKVNVK